MRCVLLWNPVSGRDRLLRAEQIRRVAESLINLGHPVEIIPTTGPGSASVQARNAAENGAENVFACGGDGTVHDVLQGLAREDSEPTAMLGIIPLGSANALARHLRLSLDPATAALQQIHGTPRTITVGKVNFGETQRYFAVMAGAGADGLLANQVHHAQKSRLGRFAYYLRAARLFLTQRFQAFEIEFIEAASGEHKTCKTVSVMATRVDNLGGLFSRLVGRQSGTEDAHLRLVIVSPPAVISLPLWFALGWMRLHPVNPLVRFVEVTEFSCRLLSGNAPHIQADGEWLGLAPMRVSLVPNAVRLLVPLESGAA